MSKKIIIGITGSIAAYKTIQLISDLNKQDYDLEVIMSHSATQFVTPLCIQSLIKKKVYIDTFDEDNPSQITHIDIVKDADLFAIIPASAHTIAKIAHGLADNMLTNAFLAATCPKMIAPAMNVHMYENPITQANIKQLKDLGIYCLEPTQGLLACGDSGKGKLPDEETILQYIQYCLSPKPLLGKHLLVTAGPTQEAIDPVRYITNHSSGKMGYAIAKAAYCLGAHVTLISGPTNLTTPLGVNRINVTSAKEMYDAVMNNYKQQDIIIMSAAVGDYTIENIASEKIKKNDQHLTLQLTKTKDILYTLGENIKPHQILCGFAMETQNLIENAQKKLIKKNCHMIIANSLKEAGAGFKGDTNVVTMITKNHIQSIPQTSKEELAYIILNQLTKEL